MSRQYRTIEWIVININNFFFFLVTTTDSITDAGGGEMDQQTDEIVIGPQPDPSMVQDTNMEEDEARSEATFRYIVPVFSKLKVSIYYFFKVTYIEVRLGLFLSI